ncbi:DUF7283 family protein [Halopiger goleimassiliensis]|uniref:DUF7283 family protein n=1 Tax=Halopiger goleimassiliensis TaxID=1293048 RepID=UPI00067793F6|nr:hypothetical protein [Halopiger goleimassiliensis]
MDFEAPVDAWYVLVAVMIITTALAGIVLGLPSAPPPDAQQTANAIEGTTSSEYAASSSYEHDAETVTINRKTITMENDHGTAHASFGYGTVVPVNGYERLENLTYGASFEDEYEAELQDGDTHAFAVFEDEVETAYEENTDEELVADGTLQARKVTVDSGIDELEPLEESITVEVAETWEPAINKIPGWDPDEFIGAVRIAYDGVEDRQISADIEGDHRLQDTFPSVIPDQFLPSPDDLDETEQLQANNAGYDSETVETKSEGFTIETTVLGQDFYAESKQPAEDPVEFDIRVSDPAGELPTETVDLELEHDEGSKTWENEIEREMDFDHDHPAIGLNDGGNYYVTLVKV